MKKRISRIRKALGTGRLFKDFIRVCFSQNRILLEGLALILLQTMVTCYFYQRYAPWLFFRAHFFRISLTSGCLLAFTLFAWLLNFLVMMGIVVTAVKSHNTRKKLDIKAQRKEVLHTIKLLLPKGVQMTLACWFAFFLVKYSLMFLMGWLPANTWLEPSVTILSTLLFTYFLCDHMRGYHWILYQYHNTPLDKKGDVWAKSQALLTDERRWITNARILLGLPLMLIPLILGGVSSALEMPLEVFLGDWKIKTLTLIFFQCCFLFVIMMRLLFYIDLEEKQLGIERVEVLPDELEDIA